MLLLPWFSRVSDLPLSVFWAINWTKLVYHRINIPLALLIEWFACRSGELLKVQDLNIVLRHFGKLNRWMDVCQVCQVLMDDNGWQLLLFVYFLYIVLMNVLVKCFTHHGPLTLGFDHGLVKLLLFLIPRVFPVYCFVLISFKYFSFSWLVSVP